MFVKFWTKNAIELWVRDRRRHLRNGPFTILKARKYPLYDGKCPFLATNTPIDSKDNIVKWCLFQGVLSALKSALQGLSPWLKSLATPKCEASVYLQIAYIAFQTFSHRFILQKFFNNSLGFAQRRWRRSKDWPLFFLNHVQRYT